MPAIYIDHGDATMIKLKNKRALVRECTAIYEETDDKGEVVSEEIRVRYFSKTVKELKLQTKWHRQKADEDPTQILWLSDTLPFIVESLPDIEGLDGKPIKVEYDKDGYPTAKTVENFEAIAKHNLQAIEKAIADDLAPKEQPSK